MNTIEESKYYLRENFEKGCSCPSCGQHVRMWKKSLISSAVADLIRLVSKYKGKPIHINEFTQQRSNFYTLSYWGLISPGNTEHSEDKKTSGEWIPTQKGIDFVNKKSVLQKYALTYNNKVICFEGKNIDIITALGNKFNYQELING